ncbi:30S ribosomal protein S20 [Clostridia bacterium]|nr:30S ribosomal protein S20 [Clostridia bacterium]
MANIKSAKKRIRVIAKKTLRNKIIKTYTKTAVKKLVTAVNAGDKDAAQAQYPKTVSAIDKACSKGIFHKNTASRKKSRLAKLVNKIAS